MRSISRSARVVAAVAILALGLLVGCSSSGSSKTGTSSGSSGGTSSAGSSGGSSGASGDAVTIKDFSFSPADLKVKAGTKITVTNKDSAAHTATSDDGAPGKFDTGDLATGKSGTITVDKPGTYKYHCSIHPSMHGTITAS